MEKRSRRGAFSDSSNANLELQQGFCAFCGLQRAFVSRLAFSTESSSRRPFSNGGRSRRRGGAQRFSTPKCSRLMFLSR